MPLSPEHPRGIPRQRSPLLLLLIAALSVSCASDPSTPDVFNGPTIAVIGPDGNVYVGDGYYNSRIAVFTRSGEFVREWGEKGYGRGQLQNPHGLAFTGDGRLLVADRDNGRIQIFNTNGDYLDEWHGGELGRPWSIAVAGDGTIFSVDGGDQDEENPRSGIVKLAADGSVLGRFGSFGSEPGELNWGHSVAVTEAGEMVFVIDLKNTRIQKFAASPTDPDSYSVATDWPSLPGGKTLDPLGVACRADTVYVTQQGEGAPIVLLNATTGEYIGEIGAGLFERAHGVYADDRNTLWVTDVDRNRVYRIRSDGTVMLTIGRE